MRLWNPLFGEWGVSRILGVLRAALLAREKKGLQVVLVLTPNVSLKHCGKKRHYVERVAKARYIDMHIYIYIYTHTWKYALLPVL